MISGKRFVRKRVFGVVLATLVGVLTLTLLLVMGREDTSADGDPLDPARFHQGQRVHIRQLSYSAYEIAGFRDSAPLVYLHDIQIVPGSDLKSARIQVREDGEGRRRADNVPSTVCDLGPPPPAGYDDFHILQRIKLCRRDAARGTPLPDYSLKTRRPTNTPRPNGVIDPLSPPEELQRGNVVSYEHIAIVLQNLLSDRIRRPDELPSVLFHTVDDLERSIPPTFTPTATYTPAPFIGKSVDWHVLTAGLSYQVTTPTPTTTPTVTPTPGLYDLFAGNSVMSELDKLQLPLSRSDFLMPQFIKNPDQTSNEELHKSWWDSAVQSEPHPDRPYLDGIRPDPYEDDDIKLLEHICPVLVRSDDIITRDPQGWKLNRVTLHSRHPYEATTTPFPILEGGVVYMSPTPNPLNPLARNRLGPADVIAATTALPSATPQTGAWLELAIEGVCKTTVDVNLKNIYFSVGELRGWPAGVFGVYPDGINRTDPSGTTVISPRWDHSPPFSQPEGVWIGGNPRRNPVHGHPLVGDVTAVATVKNVLVRGNISAAVHTPTNHAHNLQLRRPRLILHWLLQRRPRQQRLSLTLALFLVLPSVRLRPRQLFRRRLRRRPQPHGRLGQTSMPKGASFRFSPL